MKGKNPIRPPITSDGQALFVQEIFPTLQGEGLYAGWPAVFVRLGGCNLACEFCDTEFESFEEVALSEVVSRVQSAAFAGAEKLVVITGGEPLRQNITPLCEALIARGYRVQIETNGTLFRALPDAVDIVCSPKNSGLGYHAIRLDLWSRVNALKFIVSASNEDYRDVPAWDFPCAVYVQPMDEVDAEKNAANHARATEIAMQRGFRLSLQMHKIVGIR